MSKEQASKSFKPDPSTGVVIQQDSELSHLLGKLLTYVDATYADLEQRKAHKRIVKDVVYEWYYDNYDNQHEEKSLRGRPIEFPQLG